VHPPRLLPFHTAPRSSSLLPRSTPLFHAEVGIEETGTSSLEIDPHARDLRARLELPVPELSNLLGPTTQSSDDTRIADFTTAHHYFIPIKHRSYPNTVNYYLDSTDYRLTKTKTNKLTQRLAEFSYMHAYHSFQSELCFGCLERKSGIVQSLSSASSQFCIADP